MAKMKWHKETDKKAEALEKHTKDPRKRKMKIVRKGSKIEKLYKD